MIYSDCFIAYCIIIIIMNQDILHKSIRGYMNSLRSDIVFVYSILHWFSLYQVWVQHLLI